MLLMGISTISMAIFHSYVSLPEGITCFIADLLENPMRIYDMALCDMGIYNHLAGTSP
jgi:hypothetical protein